MKKKKGWKLWKLKGLNDWEREGGSDGYSRNIYKYLLLKFLSKRFPICRNVFSLISFVCMVARARYQNQSLRIRVFFYVFKTPNEQGVKGNIFQYSYDSSALVYALVNHFIKFLMLLLVGKRMLSILKKFLPLKNLQS